MKYHNDVRRWRVFWHVTMPNGEVDKGSKSFKERKEAQLFKEQVEKKEKRYKRAITIEVPYFDEVIEEWKDYLNRKSETTKITYVSWVENFKNYLAQDDILITDISANTVNCYLDFQIGSGLVNRTCNNILTSIKSLMRYAEENYKVPNEVKEIKTLDEDPPDIKVFTLDEYKVFLKNVDPFAVGWIKFLANTGLRASELTNLKWQNYDSTRRTITIVGKGRKRRTIGLNKISVEILEDAKAGEKVKLKDFIFFRKDGKPLNRHTLYIYVKTACLKSGLEIRGPHSLRHFFATQLLCKGVPIFKISKVLGHASVTTTENRYAHILSSDLSDVTGFLDAI